MLYTHFTEELLGLQIILKTKIKCSFVNDVRLKGIEKVIDDYRRYVLLERRA